MTPPEPHRAGWENRKRSGPGRVGCVVGLGRREDQGRCTRIGRTFIRGSQRKARAYGGEQRRRSLDACASGWRYALSRRVLRKQKGGWSATTGYIKIVW